MKNNEPMNTLKPQPGQSSSYNQKFHPLPGVWAQEQLQKSTYKDSTRKSSHSQTELQKALSAEESQHRYWENWQGVAPAKADYENPRQWQDTLQPNAKYGTEGSGYG